MKAVIWMTVMVLMGGFLKADVDPFSDEFATPPLSELDPFSATFGDGPVDPSDAESTFKVLSSVASFKPGEPFHLSFKLSNPRGWHSYYSNSGSAGGPVEVMWDLPEGWTAGNLIYPVPHLSPNALGAGYDYSGTNHFVTQITPPASASGTIELKAEARWQICTDQNCILEPGPSPANTIPLSISLSSSAAPVSSDAAGEIEEALAATAQVSEAWDIEVRNVGTQLQLDLLPKDGAVSELEELYFFAATAKLTDPGGAQKLKKTDKGYRLSIPKVAGDAALQDFDYSTLRGILTAKSGWEDGEDFKALAVESITIGVVDRSELYEQVSLGALLGILGAMFLGGMILNLMPCVFPVIGLKIMGFVNQAGEDKRQIVIHGLAFVVGVLVSFWLIAGVLLGLREAALSSGEQAVGWGYQLQNPYMVWGLMLIMFVLGLSMFGLFEIGAKATSVGSELQAKSGLSGTFFSGVLATVVATPCSAPFLGPAIGLAVKLPPVSFMMAFTAMALGLGAPYLILSIFPNLVKKLPRPGAWMESFKQGMSFLLFGTAGFLLWVYMGQNDSFHGLSIVLGLTLIATAAWIYGRWFLPHKSARARGIGIFLAVALLAGGLYASRPNKGDDIWQDWSQETVDAAIAEGRPVYIDFTATWCLTCQLNKKAAYPDEVKQAFKDRNVLMLRADKTNANPAIEKAIADLDRAAIPVNVLYAPAKEGEPIITPANLTPGYLLDLLEEEIPVVEE